MAYFGGARVRPRWSVSFVSLIPFLLLIAICIYAVFVIGKDLIEPRPAEKVIVREVVKEVPVNTAPATVSVLVPAKDILPGTKLTPDLFKTEVRVPVPGLKENAISDFSQIKGSYAKTFLSSDDPLMRAALTFEGPPDAITSRIPAGFRAVAIPVTAESSVEGWVYPGVHVDVVWSAKHRGMPIVTTIVENAYVLSAGRTLEKMAETGDKSDSKGKSVSAIPRYVTLLLSLKDAQKIQLAKRTNGVLSLSLRGRNDDAAMGSETMTVDSLLRSSVLASLEKIRGKVTVAGETFALKGDKLMAYSEPEEEESERAMLKTEDQQGDAASD